MRCPDVEFNPPPGWPKPPAGWVPPAGWEPDPSWPEPPAGWQLWLPETPPLTNDPERSNLSVSDEPEPDADGSEQSDRERLAALDTEVAALRARLSVNAAEPSPRESDLDILQDVGIYRYNHPLDTAAAYKERLDDISAETLQFIKSGKAIEKSELFTFNNSLAQGKKLSGDLSKLMLRAYNAEVDNALRALRAGNLARAKRRVEASRDAIARFAALMEMEISREYHSLRMRELELTSDWLMKKQEEREAERDRRAELREQAKVEQELAAERALLDKERAHLVNTLAALARQGQTNAELEARLLEIDDAIAFNDFRAANIRAGYVYVISNPGAFGPDVVKIGLTRRLEPRDRIAELSGAAVPFKFEVHALFFSEDAVTLENELHRHFSDRALNRINARKEFFFASPSEVREVLLDKVGDILEFNAEAEGIEFMQSLAEWPEHAQQLRLGPADGKRARGDHPVLP